MVFEIVPKLTDFARGCPTGTLRGTIYNASELNPLYFPNELYIETLAAEGQPEVTDFLRIRSRWTVWIAALCMMFFTNFNRSGVWVLKSSKTYFKVSGAPPPPKEDLIGNRAHEGSSCVRQNQSSFLLASPFSSLLTSLLLLLLSRIFVVFNV